ncbi:MAG: MATE family efflux transporter [Bacilli bacterium]|jgi:putative MATE family efflux protein|nr:MATE family efflux transporter [Bacilli bacterium]MDY0063465.1 MATE family efflux transporter [Bacilli bacterium]
MRILQSKKFNQLSITADLPPARTLLKNVLNISVPAALEIFFVGLIGMADMMMVGNYSKQALAAVSISQQPVFITLAFAIALNAGVVAIISRRKGENRPEDANATLRQSIIISAVVALFMTGLSVFIAQPLLTFAGAKADTIDLATTYFRIVSLSLILNYVRFMISSALRAIGKTKITLVMNIIANLVNVFFNYGFIHGNIGFPELGIAGAAIATLIGNFVAFVIAFAAIYRSKGFLSIHFKQDWRLNKSVLQSIFRISTPAFVEQIFMRIGFFFIAKIVNDLGTDQTAINAVLSNIMALSFNITDGFAVGASALVGRSLGEKDPAKAFAYGRMSQILSIFLATNMMLLVIIFRRQLAQSFSNETYIVSESARLLTLSCFVMLPQSIQWVTTGVLRGAGDTVYTAGSSLLSVMVVRPLFSYFFVYGLAMGILGSWIAMFIDQMLRMILNNIRFINLKWLKIQV